jgi:hypothetical protein
MMSSWFDKLTTNGNVQLILQVGAFSKTRLLHYAPKLQLCTNSGYCSNRGSMPLLQL